MQEDTGKVKKSFPLSETFFLSSVFVTIHLNRLILLPAERTTPSQIRSWPPELSSMWPNTWVLWASTCGRRCKQLLNTVSAQRRRWGVVFKLSRSSFTHSWTNEVEKKRQSSCQDECWKCVFPDATDMIKLYISLGLYMFRWLWW